MSWKDRDYGHERWVERGAATWGIHRPPPATLTLMIVQLSAFALVLLLRAEHGAATLAVAALDANAHWAAILLHPYATVRFLSMLFAVLALWSLAGRLEARLGGATVVALYFVGNVAAGGAYFAVASAQSALAKLPLDYPVGALAAMCMSAWWHLRQDSVNVFGRETSAAKVYAIGAAITIAMTILGSVAGSVAWLAGVAGGALAAEIVDRLPKISAARRARRIVRPSIPRHPEHRPIVAEPEIDDILAKISRSGLESLTLADRARLEAARQAKLRGED